MPVFRFFRRLLAPVNVVVSQLFYNHGRFCATHQVPVIVLVILVVLPMFYPALDTYYLNAKKDGQTYFWESPSSRSPLSEESFVRTCGTHPSLRVEQIVINVTGTNKGHRIGQGDGVLKKDLILWSWRLQDRIANTVVVYPQNVTSPLTPFSDKNAPTNSPNEYTLSDLCYKPFNDKHCFIYSPGEFWENSPERLSSDSAITNTLSKPHAKSSFGVPIPIHSVFGNPQFDSKTGRLSSADSIILTYFLEDMGGCAEGTTVEIWELLWQKVIRDENVCHTGNAQIKDIVSESDSSHLYFDFKRTHYETMAEYVLLALGYICSFLYISFSLGRLNLVKSKFGLGFSAVAQVVTSIVMSLSFCSLFSVKLTLLPLEILPFMMMIVGVENIFVLTNAVTSTSMELEVKERVGEGLKNIGVSITKYLGLELLIFVLLSATNIDVLQEFCLFASVAVIFDYIFQMTFFITTLSIDLRRLEISDLYNQRVRPTPINVQTLSRDDNVTQSRPYVILKSITLGRISSIITIFLVVAGLTTFYPNLLNPVSLSINTDQATFGEHHENRTFWTASNAADAFWDIANPTKKNLYLEIRPRKFVTLTSDIQNDTVTKSQEDPLTRSFIINWRYSLIIAIKRAAWFVKFVAAPVLVIGFSISLLLSFLLSSDNDAVSSNDSAITRLPRVITLRGRHSADVDLLCANQSGMIITTAADKHITSWDGRHGAPLKRLERYMRRCSSCKCRVTGGLKKCISWPVRALCMSENVRLAAAGFEDGTVRVWDIDSGQVMHILKDTVDDVESVVSEMAGYSSKERVTFLEFVAPTCSSPPSPTPLGSSLLLEEHKPAMLLAAYRDGYIREWDLVTGQIVHTIATNQKSGISCLCIVDDGFQNYTRDDLRMYSGARDGTVRCWIRNVCESQYEEANNETEQSDSQKSRWRAAYTIIGEHGNAVTCVSAKVVKTRKSCYGIVVTGAADGEVRVHDYFTGAQITTLSRGTLWKQKRERERAQRRSQRQLLLQQQRLQREENDAIDSDDGFWDDEDDEDTTEDEEVDEYGENSHEGSVTNILIHPLKEQGCRCGNTEGRGGFWIVTSSLDKKVHVWQLECDVMDCNCMTLRVQQTFPFDLDNKSDDTTFSGFDGRIKATRQILPHQYRIITTQGKTVVVSYPKYIGRVSQPGGSAIVLLRNSVFGVRRIKKKSCNATRRSRGAEGEWEVWMLDLDDPKVLDRLGEEQGNSESDGEITELSVRTISLIDENDLTHEEERRKKATSEFVQQRRHGVAAGFTSSYADPATSSATAIAHSPHLHNHDNSHDHTHDDHHEEDETNGQVPGQVYDFRQRASSRRSVMHRYLNNIVNDTRIDSEEEQLNELLPFAFVRQVVKVGEDGLAIGYGNFVKVVLFEDQKLVQKCN